MNKPTETKTVLRERILKIIVVSFIVLSLGTLLAQGFYVVHMRVGVDENVLHGSKYVLHPALAEGETISASQHVYERVFECKVDEKNVIKYAESWNVRWKFQPIPEGEIIKIRRYNWFQDLDRFWQEEKTLKPEEEKPDSRIHFVKNGLYYDNMEREQKSEGVRATAVYDSDNGMFYVYYRSR